MNSPLRSEPRTVRPSLVLLLSLLACPACDGNAPLPASLRDPVAIAAQGDNNDASEVAELNSGRQLHWARVAIAELATQGFLDQPGLETFRPSEPLTVGALVQLVSRSFGVAERPCAPAVAATLSANVTPSLLPRLCGLLQSGVLEPRPAGAPVDPNAAVSVGDFVSALQRALSFPEAAQLRLADYAVQGERLDGLEAAPAMRAALARGTLAFEGNPHNVEPTRVATRGEAAAMIYLALVRAGALQGTESRQLAQHQLAAGQTLAATHLNWNRDSTLADSAAFVEGFLGDPTAQRSFVAHDGVRIAYTRLRHPAARQELVILGDVGRPCLSYAETAYDLSGQRLGVTCLDLRGQGSSARLDGHPDTLYIDCFNDYVDDVAQLLQTLRSEKGAQPIALLGHGLGGAVAIRFMQLHPARVTASVLLDPLLDPQFAPPLDPRREEALGPGQSAEAPSLARASFVAYLRSAHPELAVHSASSHWLAETQAALATIAADAPRAVDPVLLLQAGADTTQNAKRQRAACDAMPSCTRQAVPSAGHTLDGETDDLRSQALNQALRFIRAR